jgi:flagellin FlaB
MFGWSKLHKNESGQAALEAAIILIAFVVVASVFAFAILSAGNASTERGEQAIYSGLQNVQASMQIKGAVIAEESATPGTVASIIFTVSPVSGGEPVNLDTTTPEVIVSYRDGAQQENSLDWDQAELVGDGDDLLEEGELFEITVDVSTLTTALAENTAFTLEVKPPTGAVLQINRTTPAALAAVMELR